MSSYLSTNDFYRVAEDGSLTANEVLSLVTKYFNGNFPVDGLSTGYLDLSQYDLSGFSSAAVTAPTFGSFNFGTISFPSVILKSSDGKSTLVITKAAATSSGNDINTGSNAELKISLTLASGVTFSIDSATTFNRNNSTLAFSASEKRIVNFKDTKGTTTTSDDIVITDNYNDTYSESSASQKGNGSKVYTYSGNGLTISDNETWNENYTFSDTGSASGSGTLSLTYQLADSSKGINIGFTLNSTVSSVNGLLTENVNLTDIKLANEGLQITAQKANATIPFVENQDISLTGPSPDASQIAAELIPFFSDFTLGVANTITFKNIDGIEINGGVGNDSITGGTKADVIEGGADNDTLSGSDGNDDLDGGSGNDSLIGGAGDDEFYADFGEFNFTTSIMGSGGKDTIVGGAGNDTVFMQFAESSYTVSKTDTTIVLTNKTDVNSVTTIDTTTNNGVEFIVFGSDSVETPPIAITDLLAGAASAKDDVLYQRGSGLFNNSTKVFTATEGYAGSPANLNGLAGNDTLFGTGIADSLSGGEGKDSLVGLAGNDYLDGGAGDDILNGGAGEDIYIVDSIGDVIKGEESFEASIFPSLYPSANSIQVKGAISYVLAIDQRIGTLTAGQFDAAAFNSGSQNFWTFTNTNAANIKGNNFAEEILGNASNNKLEGSGGNDYLTGFAGNDTLDGGSGNDDLEGSDGNDLILGGEGDDVLRADYGAYVPDVIGRVGSGGKDTLVGGSGNDVAYMQYEESIYSVTKTDTAIVLTNRNDSSSVTTIDTTQANGVELVVFGFDGEADFPLTQPISVADLLAGAASAKDDVLYLRGSGSYNGSNKIFTSSGAAANGFTINGGDGNDLIFGTTNADSLVGGAGNDSLSGLGGNDTLVGGAGNDTLELRWEQSTQTDPSISTANIVLDGGAGDDIYVINGLIDKQAISLVDSAGNDTVLMKNYWWDSHYPSAYIDGTTNTLKLHARSDFESLTPPILTAQSGVIENMSLMKYSNSSTPELAQFSVTYAITYASKDSKGVWNAKGTDKADIMFATTGGANNYDGGKGDDNISANRHADTVVQGGEGFNLLAIEDLPIDGSNGLVFGRDVYNSIGTLSYAWAVNTVEVNMEARIGIAYDAKGEEIIGMDDFYGFANVTGGKGNDAIVGDEFANRLDGGDGKDTLAGGGGFDTLIGGVGDDTYLVNLQDMKTIVSERIAPTAMGEVNGALTLQGGTDAKGADTLVLSGFSNVMNLRFGVGDSTVTVSQTDSAAIALVDKAVEQISFDTGVGTPAVYLTNWGNIGTKSADFVMTKDAGGTGIGGQGDDFLLGGQGQDILLGGLGNDIIRGGAGSDRLIGNAGNDSIYVNRGDGDLALGGAGADTFVIQGASSAGLGAGTQTSRILDFKLNEDFLRFDGAAGVSITANGITASKGNIADVANMMSFNLSNTGTLSLLNDASNAHIQVVSLIGIDTQQELSALMDRIAIA